MSQNAELFDKLMTHKLEMSDILKKLLDLDKELQDQRKSIRTLRDQLYSATMALSARRQVEVSEVFVTAAQDISLLRLVYVIFMPLIFVSVNMNFVSLAIAQADVLSELVRHEEPENRTK
ncbi:hypothetical protein BKA64DRAFT_36778 [Cadophora sp. MPI-SDFR-AT-0126]|nr:hypothetical protein BKA64DRAFT_36778 [Leotiomycetes sp. MPI-SDFR-AT-0126]